MVSPRVSFCIPVTLTYPYYFRIFPSCYYPNYIIFGILLSATRPITSDCYPQQLLHCSCRYYCCNEPGA
jgi:hypothetical protein